MIILASASPRRKELMKLVCDSFSVEPANINETPRESTVPDKIPEEIALKKAEYIHKRNHYNDIVIGCDTAVFADNRMLGKPKSSCDAADMLELLSGKTHRVITGCAVLCENKTVSFSQTTYVEFYPLGKDEIASYIASGEAMDKAGAYGIQGKGSLFVKKINGDYFNVVGLPVALLKRKLDENFAKLKNML